MLLFNGSTLNRTVYKVESDQVEVRIKEVAGGKGSYNTGGKWGTGIDLEP